MKIDITRIKNLATQLANKVNLNFDNFNTDNRKLAKDKLFVKTVDTFGDLTASPLDTDIFMVLDAGGDDALLSGKWALYWYMNTEWVRILDEVNGTRLTGDQIVTLINGSSSSIEVGHLAIDLSSYLTSGSIITDKVIVKTFAEAFSLTYKYSNTQANKSSFEPAVDDSNLTINMPDIDYIAGEHGELHINGVMIPPNTNISGHTWNQFGKYHVVDNGGKVQIVIHNNDGSQGYIQYDIVGSDIIGFKYPQLKSILI